MYNRDPFSMFYGQNQVLKLDLNKKNFFSINIYKLRNIYMYKKQIKFYLSNKNLRKDYFLKI